MQGLRLLQGTAESWFGQPLVEIHDADLWRWYAARRAARRLLGEP